ncbi:MAG: DUF819 family protein [Bacteroidia bacterium]|nr:DUF819 family protein [Bacteroidia bacterium]
MEETQAALTPLITNDAVLFGILMAILAFVFVTSSQKQGPWATFYKYVPSLLLCYFIPSLLTSGPPILEGIIGSPVRPLINAEESKLYFVASRYLLPTSLVLLTLSIDLKGILRLGPKAIIMFFTGSLGIVIGGPIAILLVSIVSPETVGGQGPEAVWRGLSTIAGSWIGGGANQTAMKEVWDVSEGTFSAMVAVDVIVANIWMAVLLLGAGRSDDIDRAFKADNSAITALKKTMSGYQDSIAKIPNLTEIMTILAIGFGMTALGHLIGDIVAPWIGENYPWLTDFSLDSQFFWIIVITTTAGLVLSFTKARNLEGAGASRLGSAFLYVLVATIGMKMDITAIFSNFGLFAVGIIWMMVHAGLMLGVGRLIKAPFFFIAVGSQANVGGAASAPVVASAFHPSLATVGVLLAVLGYAVGTYGAYICAILMRAVAPV